MPVKVVCVGGTAVDRVYRLSRMPQPGSGTHILEAARVGGGVEANVAAALARLDVRAGLVSRVGQDADGAWALDDLQRWGVETTHVWAMPDQTTDYCLVWVAPDGERMLACDNPSLRRMRLKAEDRDLCICGANPVSFRVCPGCLGTGDPGDSARCRAEGGL